MLLTVPLKKNDGERSYSTHKGLSVSALSTQMNQMLAYQHQHHLTDGFPLTFHVMEDIRARLLFGRWGSSIPLLVFNSVLNLTVISFNVGGNTH